MRLQQKPFFYIVLCMCDVCLQEHKAIFIIIYKQVSMNSSTGFPQAPPLSEIYITVVHHPCYDLSKWDIAGVHTSREMAVNHAIILAFENIEPESYDPRKRFIYDKLYGYVEDKWFLYTGSDVYWVEKWIPDTRNSGQHQSFSSSYKSIEKIPIYIDTAIKNWIADRARSSEHALETLCSWSRNASSGTVKDEGELRSFIDKADDRKWIDKDESTNPHYGSIAQLEWEKRFDKSNGLCLSHAIKSHCERHGTKAVLCISFDGNHDKEDVACSREEVFPGMYTVYRDDRVASITIEYDDLDASRLPIEVSQNVQPPFWKYDASRNKPLTIYLSQGMGEKWCHIETLATTLPWLRVILVKKIFKKPPEQAIHSLEIDTPADHLNLCAFPARSAAHHGCVPPHTVKTDCFLICGWG